MAQQQPGQGPSAIDQNDVNDWVGRLKEFVAKPAVITSPAPADHQPWNTAFFGCLDPIDLCCVTCCCPCITFGKTHHRLRKDPQLRGYSVVNVSCLGFWAAACFYVHCIPEMMQRHDIRSRYRLQGDGAMDFLKACCCACCDLIQQEKESRYHALNQTEMMVTAQPEKNDGMAYGAPPQQQPMQPQQNGDGLYQPTQAYQAPPTGEVAYNNPNPNPV